MAARDGFVPMAAWLAGPPSPGPLAPPPPAPPPPPTPPVPPPPAIAHAEAELLRDLRLLRARVGEALDAATATLVRELAYAVLGRELAIAPADVAAVAARILAEHPAASPVTIRHAPGEPVDAGVPARADATLAPGDLIVVFADGEVDARLGVRLAAVLDRRP